MPAYELNWGRDQAWRTTAGSTLQRRIKREKTWATVVES